MVPLSLDALITVTGGLGAKRTPALGPSHLTSSGKSAPLDESVMLGSQSRTARPK